MPTNAPGWLPPACSAEGGFFTVPVVITATVGRSAVPFFETPLYEVYHCGPDPECPRKAARGHNERVSPVSPPRWELLAWKRD